MTRRLRDSQPLHVEAPRAWFWIAVVALSGIMSAAADAGEPRFASRCRVLDLGFRPQALAAQDVNGDGSADLVVVRLGLPDSAVAVYLGDGHGHFTAKGDVRVGTEPHALAVRDLDGDGHVDLVVANRSSNNVSVAMGAGDGTFRIRQTLDAGLHPTDVAIEDLNGDGKLDLAVLNSGRGPRPEVSRLEALVRGDSTESDSSSVSIFVGQAGGKLRHKANLATALVPVALAAGDLNGDKKIDLAVANASDKSVSVFFGGASGAFKPKQDFDTDTGPYDVAIADVNGDGRGDLLASLARSDMVARSDTLRGGLWVALGVATGQLAPKTVWLDGVFPSRLELADIDGDRQLDLLVATHGSLAVLPGAGDGSFGAARECRMAMTLRPQDLNGPPDRLGEEQISIAAAELDGDGKMDVAFARARGQTVCLLSGNGDASFGAAHEFETGSNPSSVTVTDLNGDGRMDLVAANLGGTSLSTLLAAKEGGFGPRADVEVGEGPLYVVSGDVTGDARSDVVVLKVRGSFSELSMLRGRGDGTFEPKTLIAGGIDPTTVMLADVNGDKKLDLVVPKSNQTAVLLFINKGDGTFGVPSRITVQHQPGCVGIGDLNADGRTDVVIADSRAKIVSVLLGKGGGAFTPSPAFKVRQEPGSIVIADVTGDGKTDLVVGSRLMGDTGFVLAGMGDGTFGQRIDFKTPTGSGPVSVADLNGDQKLDIVMTNQPTRAVSILFGNGDGTFQPPLQLGTGGEPSAVAVADLDADGKLDLAVTNRDLSSVSAVLNRSE